VVVQEAHPPHILAQKLPFLSPWGLEDCASALAPLGYNAPQNAEDRFKFNGGSERGLSSLTDIHWDETPFRPYDAQLGRFWGIDWLADLFPGITPMHFGYNNPVLFNDPTGLIGEGGGDLGGKPPKALHHGFGKSDRWWGGAVRSGGGNYQAIEDLKRMQGGGGGRGDGGGRQSTGAAAPRQVGGRPAANAPTRLAPRPGGTGISVMTAVRGGLLFGLAILMTADTPIRKPSPIREYNVDVSKLRPETIRDIFDRVARGDNVDGWDVYVHGLLTHEANLFEGEMGGKRQLHHFMTDKITDWNSDKGKLVKQMYDIAKFYCLDPQGDWNKEYFSTEYHSGSHSIHYHTFVLGQMQLAQKLAGADVDAFLSYFELMVRAPVRRNPEMLRTRYQPPKWSPIP
jgi:hypothetical protein